MTATRAEKFPGAAAHRARTVGGRGVRRGTPCPARARVVQLRMALLHQELEKHWPFGGRWHRACFSRRWNTDRTDSSNLRTARRAFLRNGYTGDQVSRGSVMFPIHTILHPTDF